MSTPGDPTAYVEAVCVLHRLVPGAYHDSAIDKRPYAGRIEVDESGLRGDRQVDRSHGGPDAAVYVYAREDALRWAERLGREIPAGLFGENLRTVGLDVSGARLGERWRIGDLLLEVRQPRTPCANLSLRVGVERFHVEFDRSGRVGAKCRVLHPGAVGAGDAVVVAARPGHGVSLHDYVTGMSAAQAERLLAGETPLLPRVRARARRRLRPR